MLKCQFPHEIGRSQAPRRQQAILGTLVEYPAWVAKRRRLEEIRFEMLTVAKTPIGARVVALDSSCQGVSSYTCVSSESERKEAAMRRCSLTGRFDSSAQVVLRVSTRFYLALRLELAVVLGRMHVIERLASSQLSHMRYGLSALVGAGYPCFSAGREDGPAGGALGGG
ncbi:hypothetical protein F511_10131 [Dorcoceras hygrometricum]|uniref:Uncharacterized protein n=1 Tax=Dorcoceras hygrometricum TaxID=472368 RepID=A0A2Z7CDH3_9LAMI|nr:hypothetical protein F511_10131 [Dorcoceras hygrometricum]